ncbi:phage baseplate assembly protein W [Kibdelosporangium banguiense]|uniref:Phage baseplate assembly protein W n=1 Tax=Kibdelosporangium banguiense TaxID=1365924 RepID=A0ABS4TQ51_9PSEU|nr:GPW/gp25 family protein [Kibdelosporangium banguiense]MBP2326535.1 phage baseplate assembly protein W [Kibdelosporangium banguiense]
MTGAAFGFPFAIDTGGRVAVGRGDDALRAKIVQVLLTSPGERVNLPDFGCGLMNLVFEPDDGVLAAALEFTVGQALTRWLGIEIVVDGVDVSAQDGLVTVEVAYTRRADLTPFALRVSFR